MTEIKEARITGLQVEFIPAAFPRLGVTLDTRKIIVNVGLVLNGKVVGELKGSMAAALRLQDDEDVNKALMDLVAALNRKATERLFGTNFAEVPLAAEPPTDERR